MSIFEAIYLSFGIISILFVVGYLLVTLRGLTNKYLAARTTIKNIDSYLNRVHPEEIKSTKALMVINKEIIGYFKLRGDKK